LNLKPHQVIQSIKRLGLQPSFQSKLQRNTAI